MQFLFSEIRREYIFGIRFVHFQRDRVFLPRSDDRIDVPPHRADFLCRNKECLITSYTIEHQFLILFRVLRNDCTLSEEEVECPLLRFECISRLFRPEFYENFLLRLHSDDYAVLMMRLVRRAQTWLWMLESDNHFFLRFAEPLAAFHKDRHTLPARSGNRRAHFEIGLGI